MSTATVTSAWQRGSNGGDNEINHLCILLQADVALQSRLNLQSAVEFFAEQISHERPTTC
jgi:hypothetical protein